MPQDLYQLPDSYQWQWDAKREMTVIVLDGRDAELVFYPLFKEFSNHWNLASTPPNPTEITRWVDANFGIMPSQVMFTSTPCATWYSVSPGGRGAKITRSRCG